jgi:hypothetical protein
MLWIRGGSTARFAALLNVAQILLTSGIPWAIFFALIKHLHPPNTAVAYEVFTALQVFPAPIILLASGIFYLYVDVGSSKELAEGVNCEI